jgi:hypothetical protein
MNKREFMRASFDFSHADGYAAIRVANDSWYLDKAYEYDRQRQDGFKHANNYGPRWGDSLIKQFKGRDKEPPQPRAKKRETAAQKLARVQALLDDALSRIPMPECNQPVTLPPDEPVRTKSTPIDPTPFLGRVVWPGEAFFPPVVPPPVVPPPVSKGMLFLAEVTASKEFRNYKDWATFTLNGDNEIIVTRTKTGEFYGKLFKGPKGHQFSLREDTDVYDTARSAKVDSALRRLNLEFNIEAMAKARAKREETQRKADEESAAIKVRRALRVLGFRVDHTPPTEKEVTALYHKLAMDLVRKHGSDMASGYKNEFQPIKEAVDTVRGQWKTDKKKASSFENA